MKPVPIQFYFRSIAPVLSIRAVWRRVSSRRSTKQLCSDRLTGASKMVCALYTSLTDKYICWCICRACVVFPNWIVVSVAIATAWFVVDVCNLKKLVYLEYSLISTPALWNIYLTTGWGWVGAVWRVYDWLTDGLLVVDKINVVLIVETKIAGRNYVIVWLLVRFATSLYLTSSVVTIFKNRLLQRSV